MLITESVRFVRHPSGALSGKRFERSLLATVTGLWRTACRFLFRGLFALEELSFKLPIYLVFNVKIPSRTGGWKSVSTANISPSRWVSVQTQHLKPCLATAFPTEEWAELV